MKHQMTLVAAVVLTLSGLVSAATLAIRAPLAGASVQEGSNYTIRWALQPSATATDSFQIRLSVDDGAFNRIGVRPGTAGNEDTSWVWRGISPFSDNLNIRVRAFAGGSEIAAATSGTFAATRVARKSATEGEQKGIVAPDTKAEEKADQPIMHPPDRGAPPRDETIIAEPKQDQPIMHPPDRGDPKRDEQVTPGDVTVPGSPPVIPDPGHDRPIDGGPQTVLRLSTPNGGETIAVGSKYNIQWSCPLPVKQFDLLLSVDGGKSYITLKTGIDPHTYSFEWTVKGKAAANCRIKLLAVTTSDTVMEDLSDAPFSITSNRTAKPKDRAAERR